jgi:predicted ATPase/DNA-binding SARP family transcriptional activator
MLEVRVLGQFEVRLDGQPVEIASRPAQSLLAYLMLNAGAAQRREKLSGLFWPEATEDNARSNLRHALWRIRRALEGDGRRYLLTDHLTIAFDAAADYWLDAAELERGNSLDELIQSLSAYHGELLPGFYDDWVSLERERLQAAFERRMQSLLERLIADRRWLEALNWSERWIALGGVPEPAYRALMQAHHGLGDMSSVAAAYQRCVSALQTELGVELSDQTRALYQQLSTATTPAASAPVMPPPVPVASTPFNNLPAPATPFIGRVATRAEVATLLLDPACRLLTLFGPGGIGKTRLAVQVAAEQAAQFSDGVCFIPLASVTSPEFILSAIAHALRFSFYGGTDPQIQLLGYLRDKTMLLVMDNFEHLVEGSSLLAEMLEDAPQIKLIVTSRERLNLHGEWLFEVMGLTIPENDAAEIENFSAAQLFLQSSRRLSPGFAPSADDKPHVARICRLVQGMPLAIELAAAWVRAASLSEIEKEIKRNLDFLSTTLRDIPERHRSLRAVFEHSWQLLTAEEQRVFRSLSVFRGGFGREAAEQVAAASLLLLSALVDKSLLRRNASGRYEMHELLRQYARDKLQESDEVNAVRDRHLHFFLNMAEAAGPHLRDESQLIWLERLETEHDNLRAALKWTLTGGALQMGLRMAGALARFWYLHGYWSEGREWLEKLLKDDPRRDPAARISALLGAAWLADERGPEVGFYGEALTLCREVGDQWGEALSLRGLGVAAFNHGDRDDGQSLLAESLTLFESLCDTWGQGLAHFNLGWLAFSGDDGETHVSHETTATHWDDGLRLFQQVGDRWGAGVVLSALSYLNRFHGDYGRAAKLSKESLGLFRELGDKAGIADSLGRMGSVAFRRGDYKQADELLAEGEAIEKELGNRWGVVQTWAIRGLIAIYQGNHTQAAQFLEDSLSGALEIVEREDADFILSYLALLAYYQCEPERASQLWEETLALYRARNDRVGLAYAQNYLGLAEICRGNLARADELLNESLNHSRALGDKRGVAMGFYSLGRLAHIRGDEAHAAALFKQCLALRKEMGDKQGIAESLEGLAGALSAYDAGSDGDVAAAQAARFFGAAERVREAIGAPLPPVERATYDRDVARIREQLAEENFSSAWAEGRGMNLEGVLRGVVG